MFFKCIILLACMVISVIHANSSDHGKENKGVVLRVYYETECPFARRFMSSFDYRETVYILSSKMDIKLYPYGLAETKNNNGTLEVTCHHGPSECYGNKLHACAIDVLKDAWQSAFYTSCMMDRRFGSDSNDSAADECGKLMHIDAEPIKACASGSKGSELLRYYGMETNKAWVFAVPYITVNGVQVSQKNFQRDVCEALSKEGITTMFICN